MEIFKLFESTMGSVQPGHSSLKDLRRDQILDRYDEASRCLKTLIQSKESEIAFRRHLVDMLEKSKHNYDNKLAQAREAYQGAKKYVALEPGDSQPHTPTKRSSSAGGDDSIPYTPTAATSTPSSSSAPTASATTPNYVPNVASFAPQAVSFQQSAAAPKYFTSGPAESFDNRTSLDRRLSEFMKTFPNLNQPGGMAQSPPPPTQQTSQQPPPPSPGQQQSQAQQPQIIHNIQPIVTTFGHGQPSPMMGNNFKHHNQPGMGHFGGHHGQQQPNMPPGTNYNPHHQHHHHHHHQNQPHHNYNPHNNFSHNNRPGSRWQNQNYNNKQL